jgi:hypothetical protein
MGTAQEHADPDVWRDRVVKRGCDDVDVFEEALDSWAPPVEEKMMQRNREP